MQFEGKNILLISPEPWTHIWVSKHHYARTLAEMGAHVVFANPPKNKWKLTHTETSGLHVLDYPKFVSGLRKFPSWLSQRLIKKKIKQIETFCERKFDIIWSFDNSVFFDFTKLGTFNISHIVDLNQDFETEKAARTADICFYTTQSIGNKLRPFNSNAHFINHGYNSTQSNGIRKLPGDQKIKIVYAGNLNMPYLDWKSMHDAILKNHQADFIFIGPLNQELSNQNPTWDFLADVCRHERSYFLGRVPADDLPGYYASSDVLTICYQEAHHDDQANPHKMMEYLGTGKMIAATYTATFAHYKAPVIAMCSSNADFSLRVSECINHAQTWSSEQWQQQRKAIAQDNSYNKQIERIEKLISNDAR